MDKRARHAIAELRRLEHAATPGPWAVFGNYIEDQKKVPVAKLAQEHLEAKNAEFIASMRNALVELLQLIEQQDQEIQRLKHGGPAATTPARPVLQ